MREGGLGIAPGPRAGGFKIHVFFVFFFWLRFCDVFPSIFGYFLIDFGSEIITKTYSKSHLIFGMLFDRIFVDFWDARIFEIIDFTMKKQ